MSYIKKAGEQVAIAEYLLRKSDHLSSGTRRSVVGRLQRAIDLLNHPMPTSPQVYVRKFTYRESCGYKLPIKHFAWYFRVELTMGRGYHLPDGFFLIDKGRVSADRIPIVAVAQEGFLGQCFIDGREHIGVQVINGRFNLEV